MEYEIYRPNLPMTKITTEGDLMSGEALADILGGAYLNVTHIAAYHALIKDREDCTHILIQDIPKLADEEPNGVFPGVNGTVVLVKGICNG
jgi:hypothetical protein